MLACKAGRSAIRRIEMRKNRSIKNTEGNAAIEFALVAPALLLLMVGIVEFGLIMFVSSVIENAATSASRIGLTGRDGTGGYGESAARNTFVTNEINRFAGGIIDVTKVHFNPVVHGDYSNAGNTGTQGLGKGNEAVTYRVTYDWVFFTPLIGQFFPPNGTYTISSTVIVKNEDF